MKVSKKLTNPKMVKEQSFGTAVEAKVFGLEKMVEDLEV